MIPRTPNADTWHSTIRMIEDGDKRNATNLSAAPEDLGDNVAFLGKRFGGPASEDGVWYQIPLGAAILAPLTNPPEWEFARVPGSDANWPVMGLRTAQGASLATDHMLWFQIASFLPPAGMLREFEITVVGTGESLPIHPPNVTLQGANVNTSELVHFVGPGAEIQCVDNPITLVDYTTAHTLGINYLSGGQYEHIDLSVYRSLMLAVWSEYGAGANNNTYFYNLRCRVAKDAWTGRL